MSRHCEAFIIGGSAGSLDVLLKVLPELDAHLPFPIIMLLHRKSGNDSMLTDLLANKTKMPVKELEEKEEIKPAIVYITPPNYHLLIENDKTFSLDASEKVNFSRPSIDVTFESAAEVFQDQLVCLLLSGSNNDGTYGLQKVKEHGGITLIQDPASAVVHHMPEYALKNAIIDKVLNIEEMAAYINQLKNGRE